MPVGRARAEYHAECGRKTAVARFMAVRRCQPLRNVRPLKSRFPIGVRKTKQCPNCKREILAAAVRCRHCGATFDSARPQDAAEFQQRTELTQRLPALRRTVVVLFIFSVLPCLAPIGAVWGAIWYPTHREDVRVLPTIYGALCKNRIGHRHRPDGRHGVGNIVVLARPALKPLNH